MIRLICFLMALVTIPSVSVAGEGYFLQLERHRKEVFGDQNLDDVDGKIVFRMTTTTWLDRPFHAKIRDGFCLYTLKGKLERNKEGHLMLGLGIRSEKESKFLLQTGNEKLPVMDVSATNTSFQVEVDRSVLIGRMVTSSSELNKLTHQIADDYYVKVVPMDEVVLTE